MSADEAFKSMSLDRTSINCQVDRSFAASSESRDFDTFEDIIH
jgi:hypothetical protein